MEWYHTIILDSIIPSWRIAHFMQELYNIQLTKQHTSFALQISFASTDKQAKTC